MSSGRLFGILEDIVEFFSTKEDITEEELRHIGVLEYIPDNTIPPDTCKVIYGLITDKEYNGETFLSYTNDLYTEYPWPTDTFYVYTMSRQKLVRKIYGVGWEIDLGGTGTMNEVTMSHIGLKDIRSFDYFADGNHIPDTTSSYFNFDFSLEPITGTNQGFVFKVIEVLGRAAIENKPLKLIL